MFSRDAIWGKYCSKEVFWFSEDGAIVPNILGRSLYYTDVNPIIRGGVGARNPLLRSKLCNYNESESRA